jgi:hypothetical protein
LDVEGRADQARAVSHDAVAHAFAEFGIGSDPASIVAHLQDDVTAFHRQADRDLLRVRVLGRVEDGFVRNAVELRGNGVILDGDRALPL